MPPTPPCAFPKPPGCGTLPVPGNWRCPPGRSRCRPPAPWPGGTLPPAGAAGGPVPGSPGAAAGPRSPPGTGWDPLPPRCPHTGTGIPRLVAVGQAGVQRGVQPAALVKGGKGHIALHPVVGLGSQGHGGGSRRVKGSTGVSSPASPKAVTLSL